MQAKPRATPDRAVVLTKATLSAAEQLGLHNADLAAVIGVSEPTMSRIKSSGRTIAPESKEGELALMLIRVFRSLDPLIGGDDGKRKIWMSSYNKARQGLSEKASNALNVRLELQADYYAGAWAKYVDDQGLLDTGDIQEALNAAHAVGDDTLQQEAYGKTVPDSFTHGTSEQRKRWFDRGYQYGDFTHGDTFKTNDL